MQLKRYKSNHSEARKEKVFGLKEKRQMVDLFKIKYQKKFQGTILLGFQEKQVKAQRCNDYWGGNKLGARKGRSVKGPQLPT